MKGTIFERGNKLRNKFHRAMAWARVKRYWLFMPHKEYKKNVFYNILGMVVWFLGLYFAALWLIAYVPMKISDFIEKRKRAKEETE